MQPSERTANIELSERKAPAKIASWGRLVGFFLIGAGVVALGFLAQHAPRGSQGAATAGQLASHSQAIPIYLGAIFMDWALLFYCWAAVHHYGGNLRTLSGERWASWKDVAVDAAIAVPFWVLWEGAAYGVSRMLTVTAGSGSAKTVDSLLPHSLLEVAIWIAASVTAGVCEEMAFRGFLQRQLHALSGNIAIAVVGQGMVFGLFHSYQGWRNVVVISALGILYGALAAWRRNLRVNIVTHAFTDIWEGWLKFVVWHPIWL
ncbi:MAG TPA: CPBP family intramembrane glutamic endopeptidase [Terracidiphilus sp.]|jgi:membrane protease YdiL (CAAX protease family)|nr:CPBP family intramembrane glutamic endopeptidase [Terracidiphilus sp.]